MQHGEKWAAAMMVAVTSGVACGTTITFPGGAGGGGSSTTSSTDGGGDMISTVVVTSSVTVGPGPVGPGPGPMVTTTTGMNGCPVMNIDLNDPICSNCAEANCCVELQTCDGSMECTDHLSCLGSCTDQQCIDACATQFPLGATQLDALDQCLGSSCSDECGGGGSYPICDSGFATADFVCSTCLGTSCCMEANDCSNDMNCQDCLIQGSNGTCEATMLDEAFLDCANMNCANDCGFL